jgi:hypothetical protein
MDEEGPHGELILHEDGLFEPPAITLLPGAFAEMTL